MVAGNYDLVFSETYGAPYDPHSYIKSWATEDEAFYSALPTAGVDRDVLAAKVDPIFADLDDASRQAKWTALLQQIHNEVVALPLYGVRVLTVRGTQTLVSFTPLAFKLFCAARPFRPRKNVSLAPRVPMSTFSKPSEPTLPRNCHRH